MEKSDFKKEYKEFYMPKNKPEIIEVPEMKYVAVRGKGNPNDENGEYQKAIGLLYGIAFTIKMSYKGEHRIEGYYDYVVPPLEGFWWVDGKAGFDYSDKSTFSWISMLRLPDFVTKDVFEWAANEASAKKGEDFSAAGFFVHTEGLCVQCMHHGPFDDEPETIGNMIRFAQEEGYCIDMVMDENNPQNNRYHHEIYLSDQRKCAPENLKTVIRYPIK